MSGRPYSITVRGCKIALASRNIKNDFGYFGFRIRIYSVQIYVLLIVNEDDRLE